MNNAKEQFLTRNNHLMKHNTNIKIARFEDSLLRYRRNLLDQNCAKFDPMIFKSSEKFKMKGRE